MRLRELLVVGLFLIATSIVAQVHRPSPKDLLVNGGFEQQSAGWNFLVTGAAATGGIDETVKHSGRYSYKFTNKTGQAPNIYARLVQMISGMQPYTTYKVSCWAKGKGCGINWIGGGPGWFLRKQFPHGDFDWQQVSFEIDAGANPDAYEFMVLTESTTEALWVDDIRIEPVRVDQAKHDALYGKLDGQLAAVKKRLATVRAAATNQHRVSDPYVRLGTAVADRFIGFVETGGRDGKLSLGWMQLQLEELSQVMDQTEKLLQENCAGNWRPVNVGKVKLKDGIFYQGGKPHFFYGYGHFDSVIQDLPNFPALGASLIQDGRAGPSSMGQDGTLLEGASNVLAGLDRAEQFGMHTDFLLSPHYFPDWAMTPGVANGNIGFIHFNIFHPKAKSVVEKWEQAMARELKKKPALHSVCLANEPVYNSSGRDPVTHPMFVQFLQQKHHDIATLNKLFGTSYTNFDQVPAAGDGMPGTERARRAYYDWTTFNKQMFADWHKWMDTVLKREGLKAPTHTKIMVFQSLDRDKLHYGVDPELMCDATDLAGCDDYAFYGQGAYAYDWLQNEFFYDLLHSFRGQSVFNSENHVIPDGSGPGHIPMEHTQAALWQGGLHHQGSTTIWVWELAADPGLAGSIYFRPANVFGAGVAMEDLNRLGREVAAIDQAKPTVALLYSQPSIFWQEKYQGTIYSLYTALNFLGQDVTFVSERQLAKGTAAKVPWIIVPNASHVLDTTSPALERFARSGGKVLLVGKECLQKDEYDRPVAHKAEFPQIDLAGSDEATAGVLRGAMPSAEFDTLLDTATAKAAWGIEFRVVRKHGYVLVPMINFNKEKKTVSFASWGQRPAYDLVNAEGVKLDSIVLEPMVPRLLKVSE